MSPFIFISVIVWLLRWNSKILYIFLAFFASSFRVTEEDWLSETAVWPTLFLLNVSAALKGTHNYTLTPKKSNILYLFRREISIIHQKACKKWRYPLKNSDVMYALYEIVPKTIILKIWRVDNESFISVSYRPFWLGWQDFRFTMAYLLLAVFLLSKLKRCNDNSAKIIVNAFWRLRYWHIIWQTVLLMLMTRTLKSFVMILHKIWELKLTNLNIFLQKALWLS